MRLRLYIFSTFPRGRIFPLFENTTDIDHLLCPFIYNTAVMKIMFVLGRWHAQSMNASHQAIIPMPGPGPPRVGLKK